MKNLKKFAWLDFVVIIIFLIAIFFSFFRLKNGSNASLSLIISSNSGEYVYPLSTDAVYKIKGPLGETTVEVKDKTVHFSDSPCPNKTCVESGNLSKPGEWAACLPNEVFIRLEGSKKDSLNALDTITE